MKHENDQMRDSLWLSIFHRLDNKRVKIAVNQEPPEWSVYSSFSAIEEMKNKGKNTESERF